MHLFYPATHNSANIWIISNISGKRDVNTSRFLKSGKEPLIETGPFIPILKGCGRAAFPVFIELLYINLAGYNCFTALFRFRDNASG
jgi:hypothetical protein